MCIYATKIRQFVNPPCIKECKITGCLSYEKAKMRNGVVVKVSGEQTSEYLTMQLQLLKVGKS